MPTILTLDSVLPSRQPFSMRTLLLPLLLRIDGLGGGAAVAAAYCELVPVGGAVALCWRHSVAIGTVAMDPVHAAADAAVLAHHLHSPSDGRDSAAPSDCCRSLPLTCQTCFHRHSFYCSCSCHTPPLDRSSLERPLWPPC